MQNIMHVKVNNVHMVVLIKDLNVGRNSNSIICLFTNDDDSV